MPGKTVKIILDNIYNKSVPKPINLRPGYDMEHVFNYRPQTDNYRAPLQELLSKRKYSLYHVYCLFASFGPSVHKSQMAICFKCWKLVKITKDHWNYSCFKAETATIAKNTMPSAPNFEPACILPARQEMISPTSYQSSNCKTRIKIERWDKNHDCLGGF
ncbi:hypothetical protein RhiirA4_461531 [Rhizophagus irregularis]|uniref:Uncharacterized protein n=1 Tax=Rhizophagus irregularis TaxID=588596 RepID=A0A2I1GJ53_9GLOM|nr:hypothetical protein RhiirA4_461531 [Rhizophagus irregularis]